MTAEEITRTLKELDFIEKQIANCDDVKTRVYLDNKAKELKVILKEYIENNIGEYKGKIIKESKGVLTRSFDE